jgi:hypothetical protein
MKRPDKSIVVIPPVSLTKTMSRLYHQIFNYIKPTYLYLYMHDELII